MLREVAIPTNFGTQFAVIGFVGYNFGCMIASNMLLDSRDGFLGSSYPKTVEIKCLRVVDMATNLGLKLL